MIKIASKIGWCMLIPWLYVLTQKMFRHFFFTSIIGVDGFLIPTLDFQRSFRNEAGKMSIVKVEPELLTGLSVVGGFFLLFFHQHMCLILYRIFLINSTSFVMFFFKVYGGNCWIGTLYQMLYLRVYLWILQIFQPLHILQPNNQWPVAVEDGLLFFFLCHDDIVKVLLEFLHVGKLCFLAKGIIIELNVCLSDWSVEVG